MSSGAAMIAHMAICARCWSRLKPKFPMISYNISTKITTDLTCHCLNLMYISCILKIWIELLKESNISHIDYHYLWFTLSNKIMDLITSKMFSRISYLLIGLGQYGYEKFNFCIIDHMLKFHLNVTYYPMGTQFFKTKIKYWEHNVFKMTTMSMTV